MDIDKTDLEFLREYCKVREGDWVDERPICLRIAKILVKECVLEEAWQVLDFFEDPRRYWVDIEDLIEQAEEEEERE